MQETSKQSPVAKDVVITGDIRAALLLYRLRYWTGKARIQRDGKFWIAKTRKEWCEVETGLNEYQFRTALGILLDRGLVEKARYRFAGQPMTHLRLTDAALNGDGTPIQNGDCSPIQNGDGTPIQNGEQSPVHITESYIQGDTNKQTYGLHSAGKEPMKKLKAGEHTVADVDTVFTGTPKNALLYKVWIAEVKKLSKSKFYSATSKEAGIMSGLDKRLKKLKEEQGLDPFKFVRHAIGGWYRATKHLKSAGSLKWAPDTPDLGFMVKHLNLFLSWYDLETSGASKTAEIILGKSSSAGVKAGLPDHTDSVFEPEDIPVTSKTAAPTKPTIPGLDKFKSKFKWD